MVPEATRSRGVLLLVLLASQAAACSASTGPPLHLVVAHSSNAGRCLPGPGDPPVSGSITHLRLSLRVHNPNDPVGTFACDRMIYVFQNEQPTLQLPLKGATRIDLYAEGFHQNDVGDPTNLSNGGFRRVAVGSLLGVDAKLTAPKQPLPLLLFPTETFRCSDSRLGRARAFHSATLLPNGNVLIYGGVVASPSDPSAENLDGAGRQYLTSSAELYDVSSGSFVPIPDAAIAPVRAFHHAALIDASAPYQILLGGGVTVSDPSVEALAPNNGLAHSRLGPVDSQDAQKALTSRAAGAEVITFDPSTGTIVSHRPVAAYPPAAFQAGFAAGDTLITAGGVDYPMPDADPPAPVNQVVMQMGNLPPRMGSTQVTRLGATLAPLAGTAAPFGNTALLWGGGLSAGDPLGELISNLRGGGPPTSTTLYPSMMNVPMTQFATAVPLDSDMTGAHVLVSGGFAVVGAMPSVGLNRQPPTASVANFLVSVAPGGALSSVTPVSPAPGYLDPLCADPRRYRPAGYQSGIQLTRSDGTVRALVTGGAPSYGADPTVNPCQDCLGAADPLCAVPQAFLYTRGGALVPTLEPMQVPRFGHSMTLLRDGNVLIVGGISRATDGSGTHAVGDAELYNPRTELVPYTPGTSALDSDDPLYSELKALQLTRAPADLARTASGANFGVCGTL